MRITFFRISILSLCTIAVLFSSTALADAPIDPTTGQEAPGAHDRLDAVSRAAPTTSLIDDFNRADGSLGGDWTVHSGTCSIASNTARCGSSALATNSAADDATALSMDVEIGSGGLQYAALIQGYGGGDNNIFIKVQSNSGSVFDHFACYTGNNGSSFGQGFTPLDATFASATMTIDRAGGDVTIYFTNINGGSQSDQTYVCSGAPTPDGNGAGIGGYASLAVIDNFGSGNAMTTTHEVTTAVGSGNGSIGPASQTVNDGETATGTVSPDTGWSLDSLSGDTCTPVDNGDGTWSAANITADCAVTATFTLNSYEVTAAVTTGNGTIGPASQMVDHDGTATGTVNAETGWSLGSLDGDTCTPVDNGDGTWSAANITADCEVTASFTLNSYEVNTSVIAGSGTIGPASQMVDHDGTATGTINAEMGWSLGSLNGDTCTPVDNGDGTWSAENITEPCAIAAAFTFEQHMVPVNHPAALISLILIMLLGGWIVHFQLRN